MRDVEVIEIIQRESYWSIQTRDIGGEDAVHVVFENDIGALIGNVEISGSVQCKRAGGVQSSARSNQHGRRVAACGNELHIAIAGSASFGKVDISLRIQTHSRSD